MYRTGWYSLYSKTQSSVMVETMILLNVELCFTVVKVILECRTMFYKGQSYPWVFVILTEKYLKPACYLFESNFMSTL